MKFNLTIDKNAEAVIDRDLCINCGECRGLCPTQAIGEYQKTAVCLLQPSDGHGKVQCSFPEAREIAQEAACSTGCPLGIVPQTVAELIGRGDMERAYEYITERNPMPSICAEVCGQMCQDVCKRGIFIDEPLNMRALERYIIKEKTAVPYKYMRRFHEKIAVIGGGPAGLTAAFELSRAGYGVTIFEKDRKLGGAVNWGIPAFRADKEKIAEEIDNIISAGIEVRYNYNIGENYSLQQLWDEGFNACLIAVGASFGVKAEIPGADAAGVYDGVKVLRQIVGGIDEGVQLGEKVVVAGGGGFAADLARSLRRINKDVLCTTIDDPSDLQIDDAMVSLLAEEGVDFRTLTAPKQIISEDGKVKAVEFIKTECIEDDMGRMRSNHIRGSEFNVFCDTVIFAEGQSCSVEKITNVETYPGGKVKIDRKHRTNKELLFACGDATGESESAVEAMAAGREAAAEIDRTLRGMREADRRHLIGNAPDGQAIYPGNVAPVMPQYEEAVREGAVIRKAAPAEDIVKILRDAGVQENMPDFRYADGAHVAVIGGGIAGISAAVALAEKGYRPAIFEKYSGLGGRYRWFATDKRADQKLLRQEVEKIEMSGIPVICNVSAGASPDIEQLQKAGYKAILFAIGETAGRLPEIEGVGAAGVFDMMKLIGKIADKEKITSLGQQVLVTGEDEMAVDMARKLKEQCEQVTLMAPCSMGALHLNSKAVNAALEEGVNIVAGVELMKVYQEYGHVTGAKFKAVEENYPIDVTCDSVVIGGIQRPDTDGIAIRNMKLDLDPDGYIATDKNLITNIPGVFALGDLDMTAADAGRAGAQVIDNFLSGRDVVTDARFRGARITSVSYETAAGKQAAAETGFICGRAVFTEIQAAAEARRCMGCGYHDIQSDRCIGCGICVKMCPANAITLVPAEAVSEEV